MKMEMVAGGCRVSLGGIPHWAAWSEGQVTFSLIDGVYGHGSRIVVSKSDPFGLLYVECSDNLLGKVPASHIAKAVELAATVLGPNHFKSLEAEREYNRRLPLFKVVHFGPWFGWRSGCVMFRGKTILKWGAFGRNRPSSLIELSKGE